MHPLSYHHHRVYFNLRNPCMIVNQNQRCAAGVSVSVTRKSGREIAVAVLPVPARDRVIDFGKYKGKMLGSLPSSYLRWVSKNLRARDFEEWANLADQVLQDPIYRDRIEWEFALNVLNGNSTTSSSSSSLAVRGAVSELRDISERFGWDDFDKVAWSKVDFDLLGTSKGGRIPRLVNLNHTDTAGSQPKRPPSPTTTTIVAVSSRRMERRERQKTRLMTRRPQPQQQINNGVPVADENSIHVKEKDDDKNIAIANPIPWTPDPSAQGHEPPQWLSVPSLYSHQKPLTPATHAPNNIPCHAFLLFNISLPFLIPKQLSKRSLAGLKSSVFIFW